MKRIEFGAVEFKLHDHDKYTLWIDGPYGDEQLTKSDAIVLHKWLGEIIPLMDAKIKFQGREYSKEELDTTIKELIELRDQYADHPLSK